MSYIGRIFIVMVLVSVFAIPMHGQHYSISGKVVDAVSRAPIPNATISYKQYGENHYTATDDNGQYVLTVFQNAHVVVKASHINYQSKSNLIVCDKMVTSLDFALETKENQLNEVTVKATVQRVKQKNDTTVYYAESYKVNQDATAYDLITQKLPGIGLRDGKLEAHGETVKEIMIDGKEYFRSDITLSLKNLPADIINEVQLFDKESDYSSLTGFDDGSRKKVINITTKQGMQSSTFGKFYAGYGLDNYYKAYAMFNHFLNDRRISLFAQDNNIGEQNFSMIDLLSTSGTTMNTAPQQSPYSKGTSDNTFHPATTSDVSDLMVGGFSAGETTSHAFGGNYSDVVGKYKNVSLSGHYLFNKAINTTNYDIRDDYFNERANASLQNQSVHTYNTNHRFNTKIEWDMGANDHLTLRPSILYQRKQESSQIYLSEEDLSSLTVSELMNQDQTSDQKALNTSHELMYIHRFRKTGSSLSANVKFSYENTDEDILINLENSNEEMLSKQSTWSKNKTTALAAVGSYIQPFGRYLKIKADVGWSVTYRDIKRATERMDSLAIAMVVDSTLSGRTKSDYGGLIAGVSFLYNRRHMHFVCGGEYHSYRMRSVNDITLNNTVSPALLPFVSMRYQWGENNCQLHFLYKTEQTFPSMQQLQDAVNNTNPTLAIRGNVMLKPQYAHSATMRLLVPSKTGCGIFVFFLNAETILDYIASKRSIAGGALGAGEQRGQMLSYVNQDGYYSASSLVAYGFPWHLIKSNINVSTLLRYSYIPGFWESNLCHNKQINWNSSLTVGSNISKQVDFVVDFNLQYLKDNNDQHPATNVSYWTFSYGGQLNWQLIPSLKVVAECGHTNYFGLGTTEMDAFICNIAIAYKFLHGKRAEIRLSCDDLFDQNNNFTQQTNELFLRKSTASVIGRHALLTFTYNINTIKK